MIFAGGDQQLGLRGLGLGIGLRPVPGVGQALLAEERAAIVEMNTNGANDANEARLDAASRALLAARLTGPRDMAKLPATCASGMMTASSSSSPGTSKAELRCVNATVG